MNASSTLWTRFWVVLALLLATVAIVRRRGDVDRVPPSRPLDQMPQTIGAWTGADLGMDAHVLEILGKGVFLNRLYTPDLTSWPQQLKPGAVGLFIGYFPTQRTGQSIHSPQNCLPGSGWTFDSSGTTSLADPSGKTYQVGEYLISNGPNKSEVLYWYQSHGRKIANDYIAKIDMLTDSMRYGRTDAALVRVVTPLQPGESRLEAHQRAITFAEQVSPQLPAYIPN